jgi:hypothetical protein
VSIERVLDQYIITPQQDVNGVFEMLWFNVSDGTSSHNHALTLTVLPVGDPPVASITSIQPVAGSSTATMQWTVIDVDGTTNTNAAVFVDGEEVSVSHSCLEEGLSTQCVTLIPLPSSPSGIVMVELKVHDDELDSDVVVSYALDFASSDTVSPSEGNDGSASSIDLQTSLIVAAALLLTLATLLTVALRSRDASKPSGGTPSTSIKTDEVVEVEVEVEKEPSGLLARVNRRR